MTQTGKLTLIRTVSSRDTGDLGQSGERPAHSEALHHDRHATLAYLTDMLKQMSDIAEEIDCPTLAQLLRVGYREAALQKTLSEA